MIGSPIVLMMMNTIVTRMNTVGMMRRKRVRMYLPSPPPAGRLFGVFAGATVVVVLMSANRARWDGKGRPPTDAGRPTRLRVNDSSRRYRASVP